MEKKKKKVIKKIKLQITGGQANPAPPVGPALGQAGINIMEFCKSFNDKTKEHMGTIVPVLVSVYEDRSYDFEVKSPPAVELIKKAIKLEKGGANVKKDKVGVIKMSQIEEIAKLKINDTNAGTIESAIKTIAGTARSMGIKVE